MERYLIAYEEMDTYDFEYKENLKAVDNKKDVLNLLSNIISDENCRLVSIVHYDFVRHTSKVFKPSLNSNLKLDLEEEN